MVERAMDYLLYRTQKSGVKEFDLQMHGAVIDLLLSDIPLGPMSRQFIAALYARVAFPSKKRERQTRHNAAAVVDKLMRQFLIDSKDKTPGEADELVAKTLGIEPESLRKRRSRAL